MRRTLIRHLPISLLVAAFCALAVDAQHSGTAYRETVLAIQQEIQSNNLEQARKSLDTAFGRFPSDGGLDNLLGIVEIQQGHTALARSAFSRAIQHSPKLESAYLNLGRTYMEAAEKDAAARGQALRIYSSLLRFEPANAEANYNAAVLLAWNHDYASSLQHLSRLDSEEQKKLQVQELTCTDAMALGRDEAAARAAALMASSPELSEADAESVLPALRAAHRADLIDAIYTAANARTPLSVAGLRTLGLAQEAEGKYPEARATLERVFAEDPANPLPLVDLTRIAVSMKDYKGALGYLAHARELKPEDASLPYEFGLLCLKLDLVGEAARAMGEAVKLAPDNPTYNFGMGTVSSFAEDPSRAIPYLIRYHALRPGDPDGVLALGSTYFRNKDFDNAAIWLGKAAADPKTAARAHYYLARIDREQGKYDEAIAELTESAKLDPDQPDVFAELGAVYLQQRNYPEAQKQLNHAISLDPNNYAANFGLLQFYVFSHDPRREEQAKRFQALKGKDEAAYRETMRIIEVRPQ